jgi:two-component system, cell cycle response regulator DivK
MARKILLVEDNFDLSDLLVVYLRSIGYETSQARNAAEGIRKALAEQPDLIITDLYLPDMNGIEAATILKQDPVTSRIPIIVLTAFPFARWKDKALKAGIALCLQKPVSPAKLAEVATILIAAVSAGALYESQEIDALPKRKDDIL